MRWLRRLWSALTSRGPYAGRLDQFDDQDQQDILANRFRSGM